ncbi:glycosyl hydrolase family 18 protein [Heyndrickxia sporothermodurans]
MELIELKSNTKRPQKMMFGIVILFIMITVGLLIYLYPFASTKKELYVHDDYSILINGKIKGQAQYYGKKIYVPLNIIEKELDDSIFVEKKSVIITTKNKVIQLPIEQQNYFINQKSVRSSFPIIKKVDNNLFVDLKTLSTIYPIQYHVTGNKKMVWIEKNKDVYYKGQIINKDVKQAYLRLRTKPDLQSPYVEAVQKSEDIRIEKQLDDFYFVRTKIGVGGYIQKKYVEKKQKVSVTTNTQPETSNTLQFRAPIHLTWEAVYTKTPNPADLPKMPGVNIVSPTWFKIKNKHGEVTNLASHSYVKWAKKNGYEIWALFSNSFDPTLTREAFSNYETRQKIINQLRHFMKIYQLDGLNFDIENVDPKDGRLITQFIREASVYLHNDHKYVSMDITFIAKGNWSEFYEREKLSTVVDYIIVMAYDEHWGTSPTSGSVASLPWVENNLEQLLKEVPNEKLVLGIPFFTRLWKEEEKDGKVSVSSQALTMEQAKAWMKERKVKAVEDTESGQNYVEYHDVKANTVYKMWLEDELSLKKRAELGAKYRLAGVATWSRYFADSSAWVALQTSLSAFKTK